MRDDAIQRTGPCAAGGASALEELLAQLQACCSGWGEVESEPGGPGGLRAVWDGLTHHPDLETGWGSSLGLHLGWSACRLPPTHPGLLGAQPLRVEKASPGGWTVLMTAPFHRGVLRPAADHGLTSRCAHLCGPGAGGPPWAVPGGRAGDARLGGGWPHRSGSVSRRTSPAIRPGPGTGLQDRVRRGQRPSRGPRVVAGVWASLAAPPLPQARL